MAGPETRTGKELVCWTPPRGEVAVAEPELCIELAPLPPDPLEGCEPVDREPPWLEDALDGEPWMCPERDEDGPPDHLPADMLAAMDPGVFLAAELEATDTRVVDDYHLVEMIAAYQRVAAWAQYRMTELAGRLSRRVGMNPVGSGPGGHFALDVTAHELAPRLGISRFAAQRMVDQARLFRLKLEDTGAALERGWIDSAKAGAIARLLKDQPDDVAWEVQQVVLPDASHQTVTQVERAVSRAIISIDPMRATARHKRAREQRRVNHPKPMPDGMASIWAVLPATDAAGLDLALEAAARSARANGDSRTIDQLRADALALLGHGALDRGFIGTPTSSDSGQDDDGGTDAPAVAADAHVAVEAAPDAGSSDADGAADAGTAHTDPHSDAAATDPDADAGDEDTDATAVFRNADIDGDPGAGRAGSDSTGASRRGLAPDGDDDAPVMHTGNSFLRTPHMPVGAIGGRRAQIKVTVPLSVLVPFQQVTSCPDTGGSPGEGSAHSRPHGSTAQGSSGQAPPGAPPTGNGLPDDDGLPEDYGLPEDWYLGPPVEVAELDGYGPITPDVALALAHSGGTWQRLVTDPLSGALLDVGRTRYRPPAAIADFVRNRDGTCVRPACSAPADVCDLDHVEAWEFGGVTSADNLAPGCKSDHQVKTIGAFQLHHLGGGAFQWTTPSGHHYRRDRTGRVTPLTRWSAPGHTSRAQTTFSTDPPF